MIVSASSIPAPLSLASRIWSINSAEWQRRDVFIRCRSGLDVLQPGPERPIGFESTMDGFQAAGGFGMGSRFMVQEVGIVDKRSRHLQTHPIIAPRSNDVNPAGPQR